jgi:hypothetical protein
VTPCYVCEHPETCPILQHRNICPGAAEYRAPLILAPRRFRWREWPIVQWWWWRQYKHADRKAFRRECDRIAQQHAATQTGDN